MAEIVKARDTNAAGQPLVAVKRILPHLCNDQQYKTMFLDESRVLAQLHHEDIIQTFEIGEVEGTPYIALEYVDGQDARMLFHKTRKSDQQIPIAIACFIIGKLCDGLHHAHEQKDSHGALLGLVHRDVSLQNVLLSYEGDVKVTDFGIAMSSENIARTEVGIVKGKFGYMSPEQIKGAPLDRRSDVFAAGICLYELLTGERLFSGESDYKAVERVRNVDVQPPSNFNRLIPSSLERIVMKALAKHPRDRYQSAQDMGRALAGFCNESREAASKPDLGSYLRRVFSDEIAGKSTRSDPTPTPVGQSLPPRVVPKEDKPGRSDATLPLRTATPRISTTIPAPASVPAVPQPTPAQQVAFEPAQPTERRAPVIDAATGLAAFDNLEAPSALNMMPEPPAAPMPAPRVSEPPRAPSAPQVMRGASIPPPSRTPSQAPMRAGSAPSVPGIVPRAESIPGLPATAFLAAHGGSHDDSFDEEADFRQAGTGIDASASTLDMDWDEEEPRTQSRGFDGIDPIPDAGDEDVTRQVRVEETFPGLSTLQSGAFPPTLDELDRPPVTLDDTVAGDDAPSSRGAYVSDAAPRNHVLVVSIVLGIVVIIAAALYTFRTPPTATLRFTTMPKDAVVTVDGVRATGASSPFVIDGLKTGVEHTISVDKPGYTAWSTKINVHSEKVLDLPMVTLDREISALPEQKPEDGAAAQAPPATDEAKPRDRAPAKSPVKDEAKPAERRAAPQPNREAPKREARASRPAAEAKGGKGSLRINTRPWSKVYVDGKLIGNTPQMNIPLSAGSHKVKLVNAEFGVSKTLTVDISPGQTLTKVLTLQ